MSNDINALIRPKKELLDNLDKVALAKLEKEKKEYSNTIELYKRYQNNIKLSKGLLSEILQETEKGEDICNLFLKAVRYISRMPHPKIDANLEVNCPALEVRVFSAGG